jgi:hypothetical protein
VSASSTIGATAWHRNLAIDFALAQGNNVRAIEVARKTQTEFPNSFFPWKVIFLLPESQPSERAAALVKLKELDPFNPEFNTP